MSGETIEVGVRELRRGLSNYLRRASEGASIVVTSHDKAIAALGPPPAPVLPVRRRGILKGKIWIADDFDEWPQEILDSFEADL